MSTPYTAAGTANVSLPITLTATAIASVLLWMPTSNAEAIACFSTDARGGAAAGTPASD